MFGFAFSLGCMLLTEIVHFIAFIFSFKFILVAAQKALNHGNQNNNWTIESKQSHLKKNGEKI